MEDNKLYIVLKHFDKIEQNRLRKYIRSPYFNVNETLMILFDILTEHINKNGKAPALTKEGIWKKLFGKETYNDVRFRKLGSDLLKLVEDFLAQEVYEKNNLQRASFLLEAVSAKKMEKLYKTSIRISQLMSDQSLQKTSQYYYYQFQIQKHLYDINNAEIKRFEKTNVEDIINNLDYFYLAEKLKWYCKVLAQNYLISHEYKLFLIEEILNHLEKHLYKDIPIIQIYYLIFKTQIENENDEYYYKLKTLLSQYWTVLSFTEAEEAYTNLISFCIKKSNQGDNNFLTELFVLYKELFDREILLSTGELNPWHFRNTVMASLRLNEYTWTEAFINEFKDKLPYSFRNNAVSYNLALVYFYQKKYDKVIYLLRSVEYDDMIYNLSSKSILLAVYYELDEDDALISLMDSFKTYLYRHKDIAENKRMHYLNLMKYIRKMLKINPGDKKEIDSIRKEIEEDRKVGIASEKWVLEKLAELE